MKRGRSQVQQANMVPGDVSNDEALRPPLTDSGCLASLPSAPSLLGGRQPEGKGRGSSRSCITKASKSRRQSRTKSNHTKSLLYITPHPPSIQPRHQLPTPQPPTISFLRHFFTRATSPGTMTAAKTKAQGIIDDNAVAVFSKSYCPYCKATKALLTEMGAKFYAIELDQVGE
jgi:hypothetical protein